MLPPRHRSSVQLGSTLAIGGVFLFLGLCILWAAIVEGQWPFLIALPILALAMVGLLIAQRKNQRHSRASRPGVPALLVNAQGIGDGHLQVPWNLVRGIDLHITRLPTSDGGRVHKVVASKVTESAGVLDGSFEMRVRVSSPPPRHLVRPGLHQVQGGHVVFQLGSGIPSGQWNPLARAIAAHAQSRGIPVN